MAEQRLRVVVIIGSIREGRFGPTAAEWFASLARQRDDIEVDVIDLAQAWLPEVLPEDHGHRPKAVRDLAPWLAAADAFVVVTPEYNHSFPASLKNAIDWFYSEWHAKPVGFVSYGGRTGGMHAVEQLRLVFTEVEAVTVRAAVSLRNYWEQLDGDGKLVGHEDLDSAARTMLDRLVWWAEALRAHRTIRPYGT